MKRAINVCFLLMTGFSLFGQGEFRPGYIITNSNDTIPGSLAFTSEEVNSQKVDFKAAGQIADVTYLPGEIAAYRFDFGGKYYVSREITLDEKKEMVFLEFLIEGFANLYFLVRNTNHLYFIEVEKMGIVPLVEERIFSEEGDLIIRQKYKGILRYFFSEYGIIYPKVDDLAFNKKPLIKTTLDFNNLACPGGICIDYTRQPGKYTFSFSPIAYYLIASLSYKHYFFEEFDFATKPTPEVGFRIRASNTNWHFRRSLSLSTTLSRYQSTSDLTAGPSQYDIIIDSWYLKSVFSVDHTYKSGNKEFYHSVGLNGGVNVKQYNERRVRYDANTITYDSTFNDVSSTKMRIGGTVLGGVVFNPGSRMPVFLELKGAYDVGFKKSDGRSVADTRISLFTLGLGGGFYF